MAGDWIKMEVSLPMKPEVLAMSAATGLHPDMIVGKCFRLWSWFDQHTQDGNANGVTSVTLGFALGNGDDTTKFINAMIDVGWLIDNGTGVTLPNFDRHNGKTSKERALTAKRVAKSRSKSNDECNDSTVTTVTLQPLAREEKRREDKTTADAVFGFDSFWAAYPNKKGKGQALKIWSRLKPSNDLLQTMLNALYDQKRSEAWTKDEGRFIPHPATWLNGMRWEDEVAGVTAAPVSRAAQIHEAERKEAERRAAVAPAGPTMLEVMKSRQGAAA